MRPQPQWVPSNEPAQNTDVCGLPRLIPKTRPKSVHREAALLKVESATRRIPVRRETSHHGKLDAASMVSDIAAHRSELPARAAKPVFWGAEAQSLLEGLLSYVGSAVGHREPVGEVFAKRKPNGMD